MDMCTKRYCMATYIALVVLLLSPLVCNCDNDVLEDVCPEGRAVLITNRTEGVNPSYDGGTVENWFAVARGFVNVVKKENLPYDVIERGIESADLPCEVRTRPKDECRDHTSSSFDVGETFSDFLKWWRPILIVSSVGVGVGLVFLVTGCAFWLCRCCGRCGGGYNQKQRRDYVTWFCTLLLLLSTLGLLSGVVLTFYSNQQSFDSLDSIRVSVNRATDYGVEFAEELINDGIALFCLIEDIVQLSLQELEDLVSALRGVLDEISSDVERFLTLLEQNVDLIEASEATLDRVISSSTDLDTRQRAIEEALVGVVDLATSVLEECEDRNGDCERLPDPSIFVNTANYSLIPAISNVTAMVNKTLSDVDFQEEVSQGRSNFSECVRMIEQNITVHLNESEMELERLNGTVIEERDNITNSTREVIRRDVDECSEFGAILEGVDRGVVDLSAGYIQHCIVDQAFDIIKQYDDIRYGFGVGVCCLSLVIVVLVLLGMVLGVLGWRPKRQPYERTSISHCGGRFLLVAVGVGFVFGCMVMILSAFGFFFGSNAQKVCQSLEGPEYEGFANIVDNQELWGGSLLGEVVFDDSQKTLSLSQLLRNCEDDYAIYKAMNLSFLFDIRNDIINFTEVAERLSDEISATAESVQLASDSFFSSSALEGLIALNHLISSINIESIQSQLNDSEPTLGFSAAEVISNLRIYRNSTTDQSVQDQVDQLISAVENVSTMAEESDTQAALLLDDVTILLTVVTTTSELIEQTTEIIEYITGDGLPLVLNQISSGTFTTIAGHIDSFIEDLTNGLHNSIGLCRPLWGIYTELYNAVCFEVVDGLNGFWLSLGLCGLFFIPVIILSVITSTYYMTQQDNSAAYFLDDPYSDYLMDDTSKRNSSLSMKENNHTPSEDQV